MIQNMVDQVARAISGQMDGELDERWYRIARAAIAVIREPTEAMIDSVGYELLEAEDVTLIWKSMIDAALK